MNIKTASGVAVLLACLGLPVTFTGERADEIRGEIVEVGRYAATDGSSEFDRVTVRTREGETRELLLGEPGSCPDCVMPGDQVRARLMTGGPMDGPRQVRHMRVHRTGEDLTFRDRTGAMVQTRACNGTGPCAGTAGHPG